MLDFAGKFGASLGLRTFSAFAIEAITTAWRHDFLSVSKMSICGSALPRIFRVGAFRSAAAAI
jgi:hypothetical protein